MYDADYTMQNPRDTTSGGHTQYTELLTLSNLSYLVKHRMHAMRPVAMGTPADRTCVLTELRALQCFGGVEVMFNAVSVHVQIVSSISHCSPLNVRPL